jgi:hypothetical protein
MVAVSLPARQGEQGRIAACLDQKRIRASAQAVDAADR